MIVCAPSDIFFLILKLGKNHSFSQYLVDGEKWMDKILEVFLVVWNIEGCRDKPAVYGDPEILYIYPIHRHRS